MRLRSRGRRELDFGSVGMAVNPKRLVVMFVACCSMVDKGIFEGLKSPDIACN